MVHFLRYRPKVVAFLLITCYLERPLSEIPIRVDQRFMRVLQLVTASSLALSCMSAMAYIDPGAGSVLISLLISFAVSASVALKVWWTDIKARAGGVYRRLWKRQNTPAKAADNGDD